MKIKKIPCENQKSQLKLFHVTSTASNYLFKVNDRNTRTRSEICSKLTIKTPERRRIVLVSLFLTLNIFHTLL